MRLLSIFFLLSISLTVSSQNQLTNNKIFTVEKDKSYPKISLDDLEKETFYIPLETSKEVLLDVGAHVYYVSDKEILISNWKRGDVYIFDWNGKIVSRFNQKGGMGYLFINYLAYDEQKQEVFILDRAKKNILVYSKVGVLKRTLKYPANLYLNNIYNFDDEALLVYHQHQYEDLSQRQPYLFISKTDGQIISKANYFIDKVNPTSVATDKALFTTKTSIGNCKFGNEYFLASICSDTISVLNHNQEVSKLFVQSPGIFADSRLVTTVTLNTNDFIILSYYPYDAKRTYRDQLNGKKPPRYVEETNLLFDFKEQKFYECTDFKYAAYNVDIPSNMSVRLIKAYRLKKWLDDGDLEGELKEIAKKVDMNDNPVVQITRFK
ncbi:6-bladed beta-propeller [Sunxiuqinia elliptica]|uniref:6-bladed beta-propeller protein n=1 Tax=Sunxiuqinia elliptica TaxID=655355 RepID=A0A4R6GVM0_9BACT|nr:6-bladed beta-propeller [Sunxiuqinia elliptica]TDN98950.1 6-bladed beta-propeller protein [Sunxiuqinia elliptica]TDO56391.1 6-bladed beta-propeller protein [Sunxiuqinia elliptica]